MPNFAAELRGPVVDRPLEIAKAFDVNVIEVVGHTDEQPVTSAVSNLDRRLSSVTLGESGVRILRWADIAGLVSRALAAVELLSANPRLHSFRILPLSAAQLIGIDGRFTRWDGPGDEVRLSVIPRMSACWLKSRPVSGDWLRGAILMNAHEHEFSRRGFSLSAELPHC